MQTLPMIVQSQALTEQAQMSTRIIMVTFDLKPNNLWMLQSSGQKLTNWLQIIMQKRANRQ